MGQCQHWLVHCGWTVQLVPQYEVWVSANTGWSIVGGLYNLYLSVRYGFSVHCGCAVQLAPQCEVWGKCQHWLVHCGWTVQLVPQCEVWVSANTGWSIVGGLYNLYLSVRYGSVPTLVGPLWVDCTTCTSV